MEFYRHPTTRLKHPIIFFEALRHKSLVFRQSFALNLIFDGLGFVVGENSEPCFPQEIELGIHQISTKGRISEDIVKCVFRKRNNRR